MTSQSGAITYARTYDSYGMVTATNGNSHTDYGFAWESYGTYGDYVHMLSEVDMD
jgi:hypothetical protein